MIFFLGVHKKVFPDRVPSHHHIRSVGITLSHHNLSWKWWALGILFRWIRKTDQLTLQKVGLKTSYNFYFLSFLLLFFSIILQIIMQCFLSYDSCVLFVWTIEKIAQKFLTDFILFKWIIWYPNQIYNTCNFNVNILWIVMYLTSSVSTDFTIFHSPLRG